MLALHEGSVVGMATGFAIGRGEPAFALLHTTAGLGNAVSALATARVNRAPLVVMVGQQDRRHLAQEPFLAGRLDGLAGQYPVSVEQPVRAQDVPGALVRAHHAAVSGRGPALVIVPMDDWHAPAPEPHEVPGPDRLLRAAPRRPRRSTSSPRCSRTRSRPRSWSGPAPTPPRAGPPWWRWPSTCRARCGPRPSAPARASRRTIRSLPATCPPAARSCARCSAGHDTILAVGAPIFRQYAYEPGPLVNPGTRLALVTDDPVEAHRSPSELTVLAEPSAVCRGLVARLPARPGPEPGPFARPVSPPPPAPGEPLRAGHVLAALAERLPADAVLVEESPSSRPELHARVPARAPLGFVSAAMGGLGFAVPGTIGLRMALPDRPVLAVVGDGSSLYAIQALWSAARYGVGALFVVMANGRYAIMDKLAANTGEPAPWPSFETIDIAAIAQALGCEAMRVESHADLLAQLDEVLPGLARRDTPLVLEVAVEP